MTNRKITNTVFIAVLIGMLFASSVIVRPKNQDAYDILSVNRTVKQIQAEDDNTLDTLILGDSMVYTAYIPMKMWETYGFTTFNAGTASQHICDSYAILAGVLETQKLSLVVLDMDVTTREANPFGEDSKVLSAVGKLFPILHYHSFYKLMKSPKELLHGVLPKQTIGYKHKGYNGKKGKEPYTGETDYMTSGDESFVFTEDVLYYLNAIKELCEKNNTQLLLISTPSPVNWDLTKHEVSAAWAEENNLEFVDLNMMPDDLPIDWSNDTFDAGDHLNEDGAEKATAFLSEYIVSHYTMPDHRGDEAYASWDELLDKKGGK